MLACTGDYILPLVIAIIVILAIAITIIVVAKKHSSAKNMSNRKH